MKSKIHSLSLNQYSVDSICPNISKYENFQSEYFKLLNTYDYLEVLDYQEPVITLALLSKMSLNMLFNDINLTFSQLCENIERIFFTIYEPNPVNLSHVTNNLLRLSKIYDQLSALLKDAKYILANSEIYKAVGTQYKKSYKFILDIAFVDSNNCLNFITIVPCGSNPIAQPLRNIKFLLSLDYFIDLGIKISYAHNLLLSHSNCNMFTLQSIGIDDYVLSFVSKYKDLNIQTIPNVSYCNLCSYKNNCNNKSLLCV